jgi:anti-anti-sigma regulatory factor
VACPDEWHAAGGRGTTATLGASSHRVDPAQDVAGALDVSVSVDRTDTAVVTVTGRLIRQNAEALDRSLGSVFAADHATYVIDLAGVTRLDPTTLAAITRRAALARGRGARITIVPPGAGRNQAA